MSPDEPRAGARDADLNPYRSFHEPDGSQGRSPDPSADQRHAARSGGAVADSAAPPRRFSALAVAVGYGSDYLITEVVDRLYWQLVAQRVVSGAATMPSETTSLLAISLLGTASSVIGGFVCGSLARRDEVRHGVAQLLLGFAIFVGQVWSSGGWGLPAWYYALTIPAVSLATVTGAWLAKQRRVRRARAAQA